MKHLIVAAMLTCMVTPALGADANGQFRTYGEGDLSSCGAWTAERKKESTKQQYFYAWVDGYISAYNNYTPGVFDIGKGTDSEGRDAWIDNYCAVHPLEAISTAVQDLIIFLKNR